MDTAQRGMGLDWPTSLELIRRSARRRRGTSPGAVIFAGGAAPTISRPIAALALDDVIGAYEEQCEAIEAPAARIILMASRALAACARSADDYRKVYDRVLARCGEPVIIHWLGEMFDPALAGYWGQRTIPTRRSDGRLRGMIAPTPRRSTA